MIVKVLNGMVNYYQGDLRRINHFLKVYGFAKAIGELEGLAKQTREILEIAALTHDIGIKNCEIKYQSTAGSLQQKEGPPEARKLLNELHFDPAIIERVCWLIAYHHTYANINESDHQILVESDFLVNADEDQMAVDTILNVREKIFKTATGKSFLDHMYNLAKQEV